MSAVRKITVRVVAPLLVAGGMLGGTIAMTAGTAAPPTASQQVYYNW